jgi:charged multivesicular body protein 1
MRHALTPGQVADEAGIEMQHELGQTELTGKVPELEAKTKTADAADEDQLAQRLRALRPAASMT